ncbi:MAG: SUMF1/EgtB/PvdO family nonheme iron enzyme [Tenuifilaceae bacterium]|nr:SUMF1/EgtB/PvdO family nonheme iron enzyme [Tenuifilaceae bacterium]
MKRKTLSALLVLVIFLSSTSMKPVDEKNYIKFNGNLLVSKYELTNEEYNAFLRELKLTNQADIINKCTPDSALWATMTSYSYGKPFTSHYHFHPMYMNFPVVNISKDAINLYCSWLTEKYNSNAKRKFKKVKVRLPSEKEWKMFSSPLPGHNLPWFGTFPYVLNSKKKESICFLANLKMKDFTTGDYNYVWDGGFISLPVGKYPANRIGLYDIIGNVAEYTNDGKVKGGSWANTLEESTIEKVQDFNIPDPRVGFRLVIEIIEE